MNDFLYRWNEPIHLPSRRGAARDKNEKITAINMLCTYNAKDQAFSYFSIRRLWRNRTEGESVKYSLRVFFDSKRS